MRVFHSQLPAVGGLFTLDGDESRHLLQVRRWRAGEPLTVVDGRGCIGEASMIDPRVRGAVLRLINAEQISQPQPRLVLCLAMPKLKVWESLLPRCVELGVYRICLVASRQAESLPDTANANHKRARWHAILVEAVKQSGNPWLPLIDEPQPLPAVCAALAGQGTLQFCAALQPDAKPWSTVATAARQTAAADASQRAVWVGPEGDFTANEYAALRAAAVQFFSLGSPILRVETAAVAALTLVQHGALPAEA
jgi:16S rRNA (uracil1498-N3)-methyltransferase